MSIISRLLNNFFLIKTKNYNIIFTNWLIENFKLIKSYQQHTKLIISYLTSPFLSKMVKFS